MVKSNISINQILDSNGGDIMRNTIILPMLGFKTYVLMNTTFGNFINFNGGIIISIKKKFLIGIIIYTVISWCLVFQLLWIVYNNLVP